MLIDSSVKSIKIYKKKNLEEYLEKDSLLYCLNKGSQEEGSCFTSHRWLLDSPPKRMIFDEVYGDFLREGEEKKSILDVGGGFSNLSHTMLKYHEYHLLDIMAHDSETTLRSVENQVGKAFWIKEDWYKFNPQQTYDCIIANDIFPNVDQRIELFLQKYLPLCRELRVTLTFYNYPRFYATKRLEGDEVLYFLAWSGSQLQQVLSKYFPDDVLEELSLATESLFPNKRIVALLRLPGNA